MPQLIVSDAVIQARAAAQVVSLNGSSEGRLFANNVTTDPSFTVGSLTEASYPGYNFASLVGQWPAAVMVVPGQWVTTTPVISFASPSSGGAVTIYGAYVTQSFLGGQLSLSFNFAAPLVVNPGDPPILVQFSYNFWARSLLP